MSDGLEPPGCPIPGGCACPGGKEELAKRLGAAKADLDYLREAGMRLGPWLAAAIDDPEVCEPMKADIMVWLAAMEQTA